MYERILVAMALDHGLSAEMLEVARAIRSPGGEIFALHVVEAPYGIAQATQPDDVQSKNYERARGLMADKLAGVEDATARIVQGHVQRNIIAFAEEHDIDCIVMGSHQPDFSDFLLGSTAARVVRHAPCAVHVFRRR